VRLASDDKWEVRLEVAQHLLDLPDADAARVAEQLVEDDNAYVRKAAQRAVDRRRRCSRAATAQQKDSERLARDLRRIVAEVGTPVTDRLLRFCQRQNEQFAAAVMHELRGIVTSLKSACQAVMAEATPSRKTARLREFLALLENTVNDMAAFTKPVPLERRRERLRDVIVEAVEVARENVRKCGLDPAAVLVQVDVSEAIVLLMARHLILMALANVIKNAHEAFATGQSPLRNGRITIRSEVRDRAIGIVIADNGFGMSGDDLAAIRDFRPGRRNKCKRYGTGYGLPIAARNLAAHDGTLAIESRENAGTTVVITLPLTCDDEENHHDHARTDRRRRSTHR
jgi:signal transduction histidine kinase